MLTTISTEVDRAGEFRLAGSDAEFSIRRIPKEPMKRNAFTRILGVGLTGVVMSTQAAYHEIVLKDKPAAYWRLNDTKADSIKNHALGENAAQLDGVTSGKVTLKQSGPATETFPEFEPDSASAAFTGKGDYVRIKDPGANSPLDFKLGESITLEAWVFLNKISDGQQVYVIGKGRTGAKGMAADNQNWALRLRGEDGEACVSFLFRDERSGKEKPRTSDEFWHRWSSTKGFVPGAGWQHVAITYTFGKGDSIKGYLNGVEVKGKWDMGGKTDLGPVVDDDEVWIGSSMGGSAGNSFNGLINEVALYRRTLSASELKNRYRYIPPSPKIDVALLPKDAVRVEIVEDIPTAANWNFTPGKPVESFTIPAFGLTDVPKKYSERGVVLDRSPAFMVRAAAHVTLPAGEHKILMRSLRTSRLFWDGQLLGIAKAVAGNSGGHGEVAPIPENLPPGLRFLRNGHTEMEFTVKSDGKPHVVVAEAYVGGKGLKPDLGEFTLSVSTKGGLYRLLAPKVNVPHTDEGFLAYAEEQRAQFDKMERQRRTESLVEENKYWAKRHEFARKVMANVPAPEVPKTSGAAVQNDVDRFINARLETKNVKPAALVDDWTFLRRLSIDTTGLVPSPEQIKEFFNDKSADRRAKAIERFLNHPSWADNWVPYWQDVLAENPAILKPTLNNSGPFRFWIHESFADNKPIDRFATELISMEGSVYRGGPGGFSLATENDVPMADRAQIVSQAFLGMNLACARCHDAPYHDFKQAELFSLAAMLKQGPQEVPKSSSIPPNANIKVGRLVNVTLKPGEKVDPAWPFAKKAMHDELAVETLRENPTTREQLAAYITDPRNERFAKVIANRVWKRYFGYAIVEPVDDWETAKASHPELLAWLGRELTVNNYDLKHLARVIFNSHAYQRAIVHQDGDLTDPKVRDFAGQYRRRMSAEQIVDSMYSATGKQFDSELLTLDNDSRQAAKDFLNLGVPRRAWEFTSLSNDRDRPALAMPKTQEIINTLAMFGWRESRQSALSARDDSPNVLQPAALANGEMGNGRIARLCDGCDLTELCVTQQPVEQLVKQLFQRLLTREPSSEELATFSEYLKTGYEQRVLPAPAKSLKKEYDPSLLLSWSNHLNSKATEIKMALEEKARRGDEPTPRLQAAWRERAEDLVWALVNTPEFVFVP